MTAPEQKSTIRSLFKWWWKKKSTEARNEPGQVPEEKCTPSSGSKSFTEKKFLEKPSPVVLLSLKKDGEKNLSYYEQDVTLNEKQSCVLRKYRSFDGEEAFDKTFSSFPRKAKSDELPNRASSLQHLPRKFPEDEIKEDKRGSISKFLGRLGNSLGSLSRIGKGKKTKHSDDDVSAATESVDTSKLNQGRFRSLAKDSFHVASGNRHSCSLAFDLSDSEVISSPLAFSSSKSILLFGKTSIPPPQIDIFSPRFTASHEEDLDGSQLAQTAPSSFHHERNKDALQQGSISREFSLFTNYAPKQPFYTEGDCMHEMKLLSTNASKSHDSSKEVEAHFSAESTSTLPRNVISVVQNAKDSDGIMTSHHNDPYNAEESSDDDVFIPCTNKVFPRHNDSSIPSVRVALHDEASSVNISETNLNFLSDSSSSLCSSVDSYKIADHHLTIAPFFHRELSTTSDITDVTSMTSSLSLTPRHSYQDDDSTPGGSAFSSASLDDASGQENLDYPWCRYGAEEKEYSNNDVTNTQLCGHRGVKQPSFGDLERDFDDFVAKYNARSSLKEKNKAKFNNSNDGF